MKKLFVIAAALLTLTACNNESDGNGNSADSLTNNNSNSSIDSSLEIGCYAYTRNGDTVQLNIYEMGDSVKSSLLIALAEKDVNDGNYIASWKDGKLFGTFTFQSEGVVSSRQLAFQWKDQQLIEGYGEMDETGTRFKHPDSIRYESKMPLTKVDCAR